MAPKGWAACSSRKLWLDSKMDEYCLAKAEGALASWWPGLYDRYFKEYHWSLADDEEPVKGTLYADAEPKDATALLAQEKKKGYEKGRKCFFLNVVWFSHLVHAANL